MSAALWRQRKKQVECLNKASNVLDTVQWMLNIVQCYTWFKDLRLIPSCTRSDAYGYLSSSKEAQQYLLKQLPLYSVNTKYWYILCQYNQEYAIYQHVWFKGSFQMCQHRLLCFGGERSDTSGDPKNGKYGRILVSSHQYPMILAESRLKSPKIVIHLKFVLTNIWEICKEHIPFAEERNKNHIMKLSNDNR